MNASPMTMFNPSHRVDDLLDQVADSTEERDAVRRILSEPLAEHELDTLGRYTGATVYPIRLQRLRQRPVRAGPQALPHPRRPANRRRATMPTPRTPMRRGDARVILLGFAAWAAIAATLYAMGCGYERRGKTTTTTAPARLHRPPPAAGLTRLARALLVTLTGELLADAPGAHRALHPARGHQRLPGAARQQRAGGARRLWFWAKAPGPPSGHHRAAALRTGRHVLVRGEGLRMRWEHGDAIIAVGPHRRRRAAFRCSREQRARIPRWYPGTVKPARPGVYQRRGGNKCTPTATGPASTGASATSASTRPPWTTATLDLAGEGLARPGADGVPA